jgi:nitrite reductase/ring-hydroxylating ferredoxin subunit
MPDGFAIAPATPPTDCSNSDWYFACATHTVKAGSHVRRIIMGEPVLIGRGADAVAFAIRDVCPHRGVPLSAGRQVLHEGQTTLECPYHGWRFGTDGGCRLIPSLVEGQPWDAARIRVRTFAVHEAQGVIRVALDPAAPAPDPLAMRGSARVVVERTCELPSDALAAGVASAPVFAAPMAAKACTVHSFITPQSETHSGLALAIAWEKSWLLDASAMRLHRAAHRWLDGVIWQLTAYQ